MAKDELVPADEPGEDAPVPVRAPMKELKTPWTNACHPDRACEVGGVMYPAPAGLDAADVLWWIDFTQTQVNASRSLLNNTLGSVMGVLIGGSASFAAAIASGAPLLNAAAASAATVGAGLLLGWWFGRDSEHKPLEQRWLLYRQRARDLGAL